MLRNQHTTIKQSNRARNFLGAEKSRYTGLTNFRLKNTSSKKFDGRIPGHLIEITRNVIIAICIWR